MKHQRKQWTLDWKGSQDGPLCDWSKHWEHSRSLRSPFCKTLSLDSWITSAFHQLLSHTIYAYWLLWVRLSITTKASNCKWVLLGMHRYHFYQIEFKRVFTFEHLSIPSQAPIQIIQLEYTYKTCFIFMRCYWICMYVG